MTNLTDYRAEQIADEAAKRLAQPELKPCPFCGGEAYETSPEQNGSIFWRITCVHCYARIGGTHRTMNREAWNTRAERTCEDQLYGRDPCVFVCSLCEHITDHAEDERPNYCPNCGAKVVEE